MPNVMLNIFQYSNGILMLPTVKIAHETMFRDTKSSFVSDVYVNLLIKKLIFKMSIYLTYLFNVL